MTRCTRFLKPHVIKQYVAGPWFYPGCMLFYTKNVNNKYKEQKKKKEKNKMTKRKRQKTEDNTMTKRKDKRQYKDQKKKTEDNTMTKKKRQRTIQ
jgi:hypothetical protein